MKPESVNGNTTTHMFFGYDVKRHCGMCKQHDVLVETRGHACPYKNCDCSKCKLVRRRREIMSTQIRIRREQDKKFKVTFMKNLDDVSIQRTIDEREADIIPGGSSTSTSAETSTCYFCQKCKNHGVLMWKKDHKKKCTYANCTCDQCELIDSRRALDRHIKKPAITVTQEDSPAATTFEESSPSNSSSENSSSRNSTTGSMMSRPPKAEPQDNVLFSPDYLFPPVPFWPMDPMAMLASQNQFLISQFNMQFLLAQAFNNQQQQLP